MEGRTAQAARLLALACVLCLGQWLGGAGAELTERDLAFSMANFDRGLLDERVEELMSLWWRPSLRGLLLVEDGEYSPEDVERWGAAPGPLFPFGSQASRPILWRLTGAVLAERKRPGLGVCTEKVPEAIKQDDEFDEAVRAWKEATGLAVAALHHPLTVWPGAESWQVSSAGTMLD